MSYDATSYPYDTVVYITDMIGGQSWQGSGVLISPDEVLTASHVVYTEGIGAATDIVVSPGYNLGSSPYGSAQGTYIHYFQIDDAGDTISSDQSQYDYAVIHLSSSFDVGSMGIESNFEGGPVNVTGYPGSAGGAQVNSSQTVTPDPYYTLLDGTALGKGSSGGPVWIETSGGPEVVGIVSSENGATGYFTAITTTVFNQIESWLSQDNPTIAPTVNVQNVSVPEDASTPASSLITSVTNPNGDSITQYGFYDAGGGSGHLTLNGVAQPDNTWVDVAAANLSAVQYIGGSSPGTDTLNVEVYDATTGTWSAYSSLTATTVNEPGAATVANDFETILQRAPTAAESSEYSGQLSAGSLSSGGLIETLIATPEAQTDVFPVIDLYQAIYGRVPDAAGLQYWTGVYESLLATVLEAPGSAVNQAMVDLATPFVSDSTGEFVTRYGANPDASTYVTELYGNVLGRSPDAAGQSYWTGVMTSLLHVDTALTARAQLLERFVDSSEYKTETQPYVHGFLAASAQGTETYLGSLFQQIPDTQLAETSHSVTLVGQAMTFAGHALA
jgi:V8-like Glu-specific endopeptidase